MGIRDRCMDKADCLISEWTDPKSGQEHTIRFKADRSLEARYVLKVMGALYGKAQEALTTACE